MLKGKDTAGVLTVETSNGGTAITGSDNVSRYRVLVLSGALKLEMLGLRRRGVSVYSLVKKEFGFKGNRQKVYDQLNDWIEKNIVPPPQK